MAKKPGSGSESQGIEPDVDEYGIRVAIGGVLTSKELRGRRF